MENKRNIDYSTIARRLLKNPPPIPEPVRTETFPQFLSRLFFSLLTPYYRWKTKREKQARYMARLQQEDQLWQGEWDKSVDDFKAARGVANVKVFRR